MSKHTPGLWAINEDFEGQIKTYHPDATADEKWVADCNPEDQDLISAAPALLEAAKRAMDIINSYSHIPALFMAFNALQDAVNRAEGSPCG